MNTAWHSSSFADIISYLKKQKNLLSDRIAPLSVCWNLYHCTVHEIFGLICVSIIRKFSRSLQWRCHFAPLWECLRCLFVPVGDAWWQSLYNPGFLITARSLEYFVFAVSLDWWKLHSKWPNFTVLPYYLLVLHNFLVKLVMKCLSEQLVWCIWML